MTSRTAEEIERVVAALKEAAPELSTGAGFNIEPTHVEEALTEALDLESSTELVDRNLTAGEIVAALSQFDFARFRSRIVEEVVLAGIDYPFWCATAAHGAEDSQGRRSVGWFTAGYSEPSGFR
jgi:hypothetical protein